MKFKHEVIDTDWIWKQGLQDTHNCHWQFIIIPFFIATNNIKNKDRHCKLQNLFVVQTFGSEIQETTQHTAKNKNIRFIDANILTNSDITIIMPGGHCIEWKWFEFIKHFLIVQNLPNKGLTWAVKLECFEVCVKSFFSSENEMIYSSFEAALSYVQL